MNPICQIFSPSLLRSLNLYLESTLYVNLISMSDETLLLFHTSGDIVFGRATLLLAWRGCPFLVLSAESCGSARTAERDWMYWRSVGSRRIFPCFDLLAQKADAARLRGVLILSFSFPIPNNERQR